MILLLFSLMLNSPYLRGETLLLAPVDTTKEEYEAAIQAHPSAVSPIELHLNTKPDSKAVHMLLQSFTKAEQIFLEVEDPALTASAYKDVLRFENEEDWKEEHRRLFLISHLRLIQLADQNPVEKTSEEELSLRKNRALFYLSHLEPPTDLIPPPIFRSLEDQRRLLDQQSLSFPEEIRKKFQTVLVNGRPYSTESVLNLPKKSGNFRLTLLSPFYSSQSFTIKPEGKINWPDSPAPFVSGTCAETKTFVHHKKIKIHRPLHCAASRNLAENLAENLLTAHDPPFVPRQTTKDLSWKMTKKHWIWVGVGAVGIVLLADQMNKKSSKDQAPSESYGF